MRVLGFSARAVHGYMDFDVIFRPDLNFLTGINGSGKTTVLKGIAALASPSLRTLSGLQFREMRVNLDTKEGRCEICAEKAQQELVLSLNPGPADPLRLPLPADASLERAGIDSESDYYRSLEMEYATHDVVKRISSLPTPMTLGIDRRALGMGRVLRNRSAREYGVGRRPGEASALAKAESLAERAHAVAQANERELASALRTNLLLSAFEYRVPDLDWDQGVAVPEALQDTAAVKKKVRKALASLEMPEAEVEKNLDLFLGKLASIASIVPAGTSVNDIMRTRDDKTLRLMSEWIVNKQQFDRIVKLLDYIEVYADASQKNMFDISRYLDTINEFLVEGGKELTIDSTGRLVVKSNRLVEPQSIYALSSGETQIIVMLTHLAFHAAAKEDNVFMVDEPELSLHVRWQELFVDAICRVNPRLQLILATHAPSIILDRTDACIAI
jgi:predicted ATPase